MRKPVHREPTLAVFASPVRCGSDLFLNTLAQNPSVAAGPTSPVAGMLGSLCQHFVQCPEIVGALENGNDKTNELMRSVLMAAMRNWNGTAPCIIDKSRGWLFHYHRFRQLFPEGVFIIMVRDPAAMVESVWRRHIANPCDEAPQLTMRDRVSAMIAPDGAVGTTIRMIESAWEEGLAQDTRSHVIRYEDFCADPAQVLRITERMLNIPNHKYDTENVCPRPNPETKSYDAFLRQKFPHRGTGKVRPADRALRLPETILQDLKTTWPAYRETFGYTA